MLARMIANAFSARGLYGLCLPLVLAISRAHAGDYFVSTSGSDSNPGTSAQPFRTITYAYTFAAAGVTIHVAPGVYQDYTRGWGIHLGRSGAASHPIVLRSEVRGGAIIDGQNAADRNEGFYIDGDYNVVDGFEIRNCPNGGISIWSSGNQILNNHIHHNGNPASSSTNGKDGVYSDQNTSGNVYAANYIDHNGRSGSNLDHGLYLCGDNEVVINNMLFANAASGLQVAGYTTVSNMKVYNNVMAWNGTSGIILWQALSGVDIKNNIIYQNGHWGIGCYDATGTGVVVDHVICTGNAYGNFDWAGGGSTVAHTQGSTSSADPRFVNGSSGSFDPHLAAGSPAIQAGLNLYSTLTTDIEGSPRPASGAWDLGTFVYGSGQADTTPPTISLTAPAGGAKVSGSAVTVSANASDNVRVTSVQFKLNGAMLGNAISAEPYTFAWNTTQATNGAHTLSAVAYDAAGNQATTASVTIHVSNAVVALPTVTVSATVPNASRVAPASGQFTVTRSGDTSLALPVNCLLSGTASNGLDYVALSASITFPAGTASMPINLTPLPRSSFVGAKTATFALAPSPGYSVGLANRATVTIGGNSVPLTIAKATGNNFKLSWASARSRAYRVAFKPTLTDTAWIDLSGLLTANKTTTSSYTDNSATGQAQRYYVVYVTN